MKILFLKPMWLALGLCLLCQSGLEAAPKRPENALVSKRMLASGGGLSLYTYVEYYFPEWPVDQIPVEVKSENAVIQVKLNPNGEWKRMDRFKLGVPRDAADGNTFFLNFMGAPVLMKVSKLQPLSPASRRHNVAGFALKEDFYLLVRTWDSAKRSGTFEVNKQAVDYTLEKQFEYTFSMPPLIYTLQMAYPLSPNIIAVYATDQQEEDKSTVWFVTFLDMKSKSSLGTIKGTNIVVLPGQNKLIWNEYVAGGGQPDLAKRKVVEILDSTGKLTSEVDSLIGK